MEDTKSQKGLKCDNAFSVAMETDESCCLQTPLSVIQGGKSFNSGKPVARNSFLYTFDDPGMYCVASQGGPGFCGTVSVLKDGEGRV